MIWTGSGNTFIGCMNAKYHFNLWRPVTAIREGGGMASYFGTPNVALRVTSTYAVPAALGGGTVTATRTYSSSRELLHEVQAARIYGGMHFQHSVVQGTLLGQKVAHQLVHNYFKPLRPEHD